MLITSGVPGFIVYSILYKKVLISEHRYNVHNKVYLISLYTVLVFALTLIALSFIISIDSIREIIPDSQYLRLGLKLLAFFGTSLLVAVILGFWILPLIIKPLNKINFNKSLFQDSKSALSEAITTYNFETYTPYVYVFDFENNNIIEGPVRYIGQDDILQFYGPQENERSEFEEVVELFNEQCDENFEKAQIVLDSVNKLKYYVLHVDIED
ncbi:Na+/H+-dicarboxylate symporter [Salinicoccus halitifaciens]|uniref:Na+/H+-dicarboxylate symporter n=2 Tax=Salinicoccus halitifaciens TaxID=1073415 RepID=A0ABV2E8E5_9STAP